jgi:hypothetical protein
LWISIAHKAVESSENSNVTAIRAYCEGELNRTA